MTNISEWLRSARAGLRSQGVETQRTDTLRAAFAAPRRRVARVKGIVLEGEFTPSENAVLQSRAPIFSGETLPVTARFSDFTGFGDISDTNPRGLAVRFRPRHGAGTDIVSHSFNGFPTRRTAECGERLRAMDAGGSRTAAPQSYATCAYYGVDAMEFSHVGHRERFVRPRFVPAAGEHFLTPREIAARGRDYLRDEMTERLRAGPVVFYLIAHIAAVEDDLIDPSVDWSRDRPPVLLGTVTLRGMSPDPACADRALSPMPGHGADDIVAVNAMLMRCSQARMARQLRMA